MPEQQWDERLLEYVKRTGEDLKRTGEELLGEAQKTLDELRVPEAQERWMARLSELRAWATSKFIEARSRAEEALGVDSPKKAPGRSRKTPKKAGAGSRRTSKGGARPKRPASRKR